MAESISKLQRWLDLISFLVSHRFPVTVDQVMEGVQAYAGRWMDGDETARQSVRRQFERDKDELRAFGIPIETRPLGAAWAGEIEEGYHLSRRNFFLPYVRVVTEEGGEAVPGFEPRAGASGGQRSPGAPMVRLTPEEAQRAADGLRTLADTPGFPLAHEARSALRKLTFDLEPPAPPETPVRFLPPPGVAQIRARLDTLSRALLTRKRVEFPYHSIYRDAREDRLAHPYGLFLRRSHWYLVGHDLERNALRLFRVSRMGEVALNTHRPGTPDYEIPADFQLGAFTGRDAWDLHGDESPPLDARVEFRFPLSLWAQRNEMGELLEDRSDGSQLRAFTVRDEGPFLRWVLSLGNEAAIVTPEPLAQALKDLAEAVARGHGELQQVTTGEVADA